MQPFDDEHVPGLAFKETELGVDVIVAAPDTGDVGAGPGAGVSVPVIVEPSSARHRVVMVVPSNVNVMPRRNGAVSPGSVNATVAMLPLTVPETLDRPSPHPAQMMIVVPDTEAPV